MRQCSLFSLPGQALAPTLPGKPVCHELFHKRCQASAIVQIRRFAHSLSLGHIDLNGVCEGF